MKKIVYSLIISLLCSCQSFFKSEVSPPEQSTKPQLVVHGYVSPQNSEIKVSVGLSNPVFGKQHSDNQIITDAQVILRNSGNQSISLSFDASKGYYKTTTDLFPINSGETYQLDVKDTQGNHATAECTVPENIATTIGNIRVIKTKEAENESFQIAFQFQDTPNLRNYYIAEAWADTDNGHFKRKAEIKPFTDNNRDGQTISVRSEKTPGKAQTVEKVEIILLSADYNYYQYVKTVLMQSEIKDLGAFAEPIFITSNIKGGLGVFGAYSQQQVTVSF